MEGVNSSVQLDVAPLDCDLSPAHRLLAVGLVTGALHVYSYCQPPARTPGKVAVAEDGFSTKLVHAIKTRPNTEDCSARAVAFTSDGAHIISGGSDGSLCVFDSEAGVQRRAVGEAHHAAVSAVCAMGGEYGSLLASGDEDGGLKLWDSRTCAEVLSYSGHTDYVSGFALHSRDKCLLAVSGDGTMSVHDLRQRKVRARSEDDADDELLSVAVMKGGKKVVVGSQSGVMGIYSWGHFKDCSDRFPGHPESVQSLVVYDEDTLLTGSSDGCIRIVNVLPNKLLGVVGEHVDLPIECLCLSADKRTLASVSHDNTVKLWDVSYLGEEGEADGEEGSEDGGGGEEVDAAALAVGAGRAGRVHAAVEMHGGGRRARRVQGHTDAGSDGEGDDGGTSSSHEDEDSDNSDDVGQEGGVHGDSEQGRDNDGVAAAAAAEGVSASGRGDGSGETSDEDADADLQQAQVDTGTAGMLHCRQAEQSGQRHRTPQVNGIKQAVSNEGSDVEETDDSDSEEDGKKSRKKRKREKTKWTRGREQQCKAKGGGGGFFDGLL